jgi:3-methyladenine DNA glycosylase/8-oxoguanine DNA glycosylase
VAELSLQKSVYGSASWECKRGFIRCICYKNISSVSAQRHCGRLKSQTWSEKHEQISNFYVAELSL